jgi:glycosyltransferase involved in cell wall biosynthesis
MSTSPPLPVTAVMGTIDEAENLRLLLPRLRPIVCEIVIVDDASRDDTIAVARAHDALVIARPRRLGIGSAIYAAVARATQPAIAPMDADGSHPPEALVEAYGLIDAGCDIVRFSRFLARSHWDAPRARRVALRIFGAALAAASRLPLSDPTNGFMLARRECFAGPTRFRDDPGEGWVADFLARNRGRSMVELPYAHAARVHGRSRNSALRELARAVRSVRFGVAGARPFS